MNKVSTYLPNISRIDNVVSYATVFSVVTQRSSVTRDDTKDSCEAALTTVCMAVVCLLSQSAQASFSGSITFYAG